MLKANPVDVVSWELISKLSTNSAEETSKPVVNVYSFTSSPAAVPTTNILVPSVLKANPDGTISWELTSKLSTKEAVETSKPVDNVYSLTSSPS